MTYTFIGLGNMAGAILRGMVQSKNYEGDTLLGYEPDEGRARQMRDELGVTLAQSCEEAARQGDVVVLAVKPQVMPQVLENIASNLKPGALVITIAAGLPLSLYAQALGDDVPVVRVLPSINARVLSACSALCPGPAAREEHIALAQSMFASVGTVHTVSEQLLPAFTALAGAAPAFQFQFVDALAAAGVQAGLPRGLSQQIAAEMALGSAKLLLESGEHPRHLMDLVQSPGGTTVEGVHALDRCGFSHAVHQAVRAVIEKDKQLGEKK